MRGEGRTCPLGIYQRVCVLRALASLLSKPCPLWATLTYDFAFVAGVVKAPPERRREEDAQDGRLTRGAADAVGRDDERTSGAAFWDLDPNGAPDSERGPGRHCRRHGSEAGAGSGPSPDRAGGAKADAGADGGRPSGSNLTVEPRFRSGRVEKTRVIA